MHMLVHTQTHMHVQSRMLGHLTHTSTHCIENHMCVRVELRPRTLRVDVQPDFPVAQGFKPELSW